MTPPSFPADAPQQAPATTAQPAKKPRDPRLDFFRGIAMLIIFIAHVPGNAWVGYIPARFGWSDATEMFVFCSGFAAAIAFGGTFVKAGFGYGTARIAFRTWQVYAAHVGMFFFVAGIVAAGTHWLGTRDYIAQLNLTFFFENAPTAILGVFTLTYVPNYFDILPMYIGALALVPAVMALARLHVLAPLAASFTLYWLNFTLGWGLPAELWKEGYSREWFFNPMAWQLLFFTGFSFAMGWLPPPPKSAALTWACALFVLVSIPSAHWPTAQHFEFLRWMREVIWELRDKTDFGVLRYLHFLALAYLALRLVEGREAHLLARWAMPVVTVGRNSLAVFLLSMGLARIGGMALDLMGRTALTWALINLGGMAILIGFAYWCTLLKRQPWRETARAVGPAKVSRAPAGEGAPGGRAAGAE
ncbi:MAG: OpgC domain-containing protein [Alphaproteobacteria bacterium]|nr:OpgC domain-containing protein [Alphaproteobacteria bacterium]